MFFSAHNRHRFLDDRESSWFGRSISTVLFSVVLTFGLVRTAAGQRIDVIALSGQPAPGSDATFNAFGNAIINDEGQVAFSASLNDPDGGSLSHGIYFVSGNSLTQIARSGQTVPDGDSVFFTVYSQSLNNAGQVLFQGINSDTTNIEVFYSNSEALTQIPPQPVADGSGIITSGAPHGINDSGQILISAGVKNAQGEAVDGGMFLIDDYGGKLTQIVRQNQQTPNGLDRFTRIRQAHLNASGQVAFGSEITGPRSNPFENFGIYRGDGAELVEIVRSGQAVPEGSGIFDNVGLNIPYSIALNDNGQVAFAAQIEVEYGRAYEDGVYRGDGHTLEQIARQGQLAPDGETRLLSFTHYTPINNQGQVAFNALIGAGGRRALYRGDGETLTEIVRFGQAIPNSEHVFSYFYDPMLNDSGQVVFEDPAGLFLFDDRHGLLAVARLGDSFLDSTFTTSHFHLQNTIFNSPNRSQRSLNNSGQVAFTFRLADGRRGVAVWSLVPEPVSFSLLVIGVVVTLSLSRYRTPRHP